jgi:RNA polymerase sigma-70 factor (ECF subfamily)
MISETIRRAQAGDESAFAELYTQHKQRIHFLCLKMTHNQEKAEDLTQDTFVTAYQKISLFRGDSSFATWLYRIAFNTTLISFRKKRVSTLEFDELRECGSNGGHSLFMESRALITHDDHLEQVPARLAIERAVGELPRCQKRIFILRYFAGMNDREVAAALDCSVGNSKGQASRARDKVRRALRSKRTPAGIRF